MPDADARVDFKKKANGLVSEVLGAEPHHQREEEVLFPAIEELGIAGPPNMMRTELRPNTQPLKTLRKGCDINTSNQRTKYLYHLASYLKHAHMAPPPCVFSALLDSCVAGQFYVQALIVALPDG